MKQRTKTNFMRPSALLLSILLLLLFSTSANAINTKTCTTTGNWSTASIWSPSGVPSDTDNVIINSGVTLTVDGDYTCRNLTIGSATTTSTTLKIITAGNTFICTGALDVNASNTNNTYLVDAGPGSMSFTGTFSHWGTAGTNKFQVGSGSINFTPAVSITDIDQFIVFNGAGSITFSSNFSDGYNNMTFYTGCTINFYGNYTITGSNIDWGGKGTANFYGTGTITDTKNIILNDMNIMTSATTTLAAGAGTFTVYGNMLLNSSCTFNMNDNFDLNGNLTNNGGTISAGSVTLTMLGSAATISGTSNLTLPSLQIGKTSGATNSLVTMSRSTTCTNLTLSSTTKNRSLSLSSGVTLTVTGNLSINQPSRNNRYSTLSVGAGTCTVAGNLTFTGTNNGITRLCKIAVTSGSFSLTGTVTWMSNTAVATETITASTGTLTFASAITMGSGSGTMSVTSGGTINFNNTSSVFSFGGSTAPVFTTSSSCTVNFSKGLTATTTALTFALGSNAVFKGTGTITPTAAITFGNVQINSSYTLTAAGNFAVKGNWTNSGTFTPSTYTVSFTGGGTQQITRSGGETFYGLSVSPYGTTVKLNNDVIVTSALTMGGATINMNTYTLQLGNGSGAAFTYTAGGAAYGGTFKRYWPATAITSTSGNYYGLFPIGNTTDYRPLTINSTVSPTTGGYVMATHTDANSSTNVSYTDNEGSSIQAISDIHSDLSTSGVVGGTYNIAVKFTNMGSQGSISNLKLVTYTGSTMGSCGTHATTAGPLAAPTAYRTGLTLSNLSNAWVIGTNDRASTPMYNYVYSRKTGNWNDNSATGTWSYTAGGSGAACSCLPGSSGYATIENGHTVTSTITDTIKFLDINSGGALTINSSTIMNVLSSLDMYGTATFTNNGTLKVGNQLLLSSATSPTVNGPVTVTSYFTLPTGAAYTQSSGTLTINGDIDLNGTMSMASGTTLVLDGSGSHISGTGTFTTASGGSFPITNNKIIDASCTLTIGTSGTNTAVSIGASSTVNNLGTITINGNLTGTNSSTSIWINNANSYLGVSGTVLSTGSLDVSTSPNTVEYTGSGSQTITVPLSSYYTLKAANTGTKTLGGASVVVDNEVNIGGSVILDETTNVLSGDANLVMAGTSELKLSRSTDLEVYPELRGTYSLSGGTVTLNQTGDSCMVNRGPYYNLKLTGSTPFELDAVETISNNLDMQGSTTIGDNGVLNVGGIFTYASTGSSQLYDSIAVNGIVLTSGTIGTNGESINVYGVNGWTKATAATFTASTGTVYFTGTDAQTLGGTSTTQTFNGLCTNKSTNTMTVGGSTTTLSVAGDMIIHSGTFAAGTATAINMTAGNWVNNGGTFTPGSGTVTFNSTAVSQAIQGTGTTETFNNLTLNKSGYTLTGGGSIATLNLNGNMTLTAGTLDAGTITDINMTSGNWTNNGGTFTPQTSNVTFSGTGAQAINGTAASQTFNKLTVNKSSNTLSVSGSTTALTANSDVTLTAGTFDKGTATTINAAGDWINNGGTFTYGTGTVNFNGTIAQAIRGSASAQTFYNLTLNKSTNNLTISGSTGTVTVNNTLTFTSGLLVTGSNKVSIPTTATVSGAGTAKYIYGNEEIYIPNSAAPSKTFYVGDASVYAPITLAFVGTTSGSGAVTGSTASGDDADIANSGINSSLSVNRTWTMSNSGVAGFTSFSPTFTFVAGDLDGGATYSNFVVRKLISSTWSAPTIGTIAATSTQCTGETTFGKCQVGEANTLTVTTQPSNATVCNGYATSFTSASTSTPTPTVKWQRDPNTGTFADITAGMDGSVYTNYTSTTLNLSDVAGLSNYKYRAVFTNVNGTATSNQATLTANSTPSITASTPGSRCDAGTVSLGATASTGTINWYAASTGGSSLGTGTSYTTPSISTTTTYYVDATSGCTTATRTAITATVTATPTITGTTPGSVCNAGTVALGATASAGTINWYAASSGGSSLGTGTSYTTGSISTTTTYYVDATASGCTTGSRTSVDATVTATPTISGTTPGSRCDAGTVALGATASAGTINWYAASSGGSSLGTGTSYTTGSISSNTTYYVDATASGCTTSSRTSVIATVNTTPTISGTTPGSRCDVGTVALGATASTGTINWYASSSGGSSLGTGTSYTTGSLSPTATYYYYVDATENGCTTGSRTSVTASVATTPTISGSTPGSRCDAGTVALGATASAGTINWYAASSGGSSLGTGTSYTTGSISSNTTYYVDATASGCTTSSRTSVLATVNTTPTISGTTPGSRCDAGTVALGATASAGTINWYAASSGGSSLGTGTSYTTGSISSNTTYYVDATSSGCTTSSRTSVLATVNTTPTISGTTPDSRCDAGTVALGSTASAGTINWYAASSGGSSLGTGTSYTTGSISSNTTYYVDATASGCTTSSRTSVLATVNTTPTISGTTPGSRCDAGTVALGATASAGTINWYATSSGGSSLGTGTSYTTGSISSNTTYYVDATSNGCTTSSRTSVLATVNTTPTISGTTPGAVCDAGTVGLGATASAGTINWHAASSGGSSLGTGTSYTTGSISSSTT